jgi:hypothetical protein
MSFHARCLPRLLLNAAAMTAPLAAQVPFFGFQVGASMPVVQLKEDFGSKMALQGTAFLFLDRYDGHAIKPRLDYVSFREPDFLKDTLGAGHSLKMDVVSLGADYNYYFTQRGGEGFYLLAGLQAVQAHTRWESPGGPLDKKRIGASLAGGLGMVLVPHVGLEARFAGGNLFPRFRETGEAYENTASSVTLSLVLLF